VRAYLRVDCGQWISYDSPTTMFSQNFHVYGMVNLESCAS